MVVKSPKEMFRMLLSEMRQNTGEAVNIYLELAHLVSDPQVKETLESRAFTSEKTFERLDECFDLVGEQPVRLSGRLQQFFMEEFRKELAEIQSSAGRQLFILAKLNQLTQLRIAEYTILIAAADMAGLHEASVLLGSCLLDRLAFVEGTHGLIRSMVEKKRGERKAAARAA